MSDGQESPTADSRRPGRVRRVSVAILVILGSVLSLFSVLAVWTRNTVLDTDHYVAAVAPLATNPAVIDAGATRITARIMEATDLENNLADSLPPRAAAAAPAMRAAAEKIVHDAALQVLSSDEFAQVWEAANRNAHAQVVAALTGTRSGNVTIDDGTVVIDLAPAVDRVRDRLQGLGLDVSSKVPDQQIDTTIELFHSPSLGLAQDGIQLLQRLAWVLPLLTILLFGSAIALSPKRRRTLLRSGLGLAVAMVVLLTSLNLGRVPYLGLFPRPEGKQAGGAAYDQILESLRLQSRAVFAVGLVVAIGAWLAGPSASATRIRSMATGHARSAERGPFASWVAQARVGLAVGVVAIGGVALVALDQPTGWTVLTVALIVLLAVALIAFVGRPNPSAPREVTP